jgi:hypothetical protein
MRECNWSTTCCGSPLSFWTLSVLATLQNPVQPNTVVRECTGQPFDVGDPSHSGPYPSWPPSRTRSSRIQWCESVPVNHSTWKTPLSLILFFLAKQTQMPEQQFLAKHAAQTEADSSARATKEAWPPNHERAPNMNGFDCQNLPRSADTTTTPNQVVRDL